MTIPPNVGLQLVDFNDGLLKPDRRIFRTAVEHLVRQLAGDLWLLFRQPDPAATDGLNSLLPVKRYGPLAASR